MNATDTASLPPYGNGTLPAGIRSRMVNNNNGLMVHVLEAASRRRAARARCCCMASRNSPTVGGRSCCRSRRRAITSSPPTSAAMGAPPAGMTPTTPIGDPFRNVNMVRDAMGLVYALGYRSVAGVVGHDAGSPVASWCAVIRPDIFRRLALMSSPFPGPPKIQLRHRQRRGAGAAALHR